MNNRTSFKPAVFTTIVLQHLPGQKKTARQVQNESMYFDQILWWLDLNKSESSEKKTNNQLTFVVFVDVAIHSSVFFIGLFNWD